MKSAALKPRNDSVLSVSHSGDFSRTQQFLAKILKPDIRSRLEAFGQVGVQALASATPQRSGATAAAWGYKVEQKAGVWGISWTNTNRRKGVPIAIILEYGHATGTGGWVRGRSYIPRAIQPVMDKIADDVWKVVTNAP